MITRIGLVAGDIWNYLEKDNPSASMEQLTEAMGVDRELLMMSIGWLAREGHVVLVGDLPDSVIKLKN